MSTAQAFPGEDMFLFEEEEEEEGVEISDFEVTPAVLQFNRRARRRPIVVWAAELHPLR